MQPGRKSLAGIALFGALALLGGCASSTSTATGANTIEGGVKIPSSPAVTRTRLSLRQLSAGTEALCSASVNKMPPSPGSHR